MWGDLVLTSSPHLGVKKQCVRGLLLSASLPLWAVSVSDSPSLISQTIPSARAGTSTTPLRAGTSMSVSPLNSSVRPVSTSV